MEPLDNHLSNEDRLDLDWLKQRLAACPVGHTLHYWAVTSSTMSVAATLAHDPATRSGTVVVADLQRAGRGRRGRTWETPPGRALLLSVLLRPPHYTLPLGHAAMLAGVALLEAVREAVPELTTRLALKWPNDLLIGPDPAQAGKAAGILVESSLHGDGTLDYLVMGIGVNVNQSAAELPSVSPPALPPTSLRLAAGRPLRRSLLLALLCERLAVWLTRPAAEIAAAWRGRLSTLGQEVAVYGEGLAAAPTLIGQAVAVTATGGLVVRDSAGRLHTVHAADVSVRSQHPNAGRG